MTTDALHARLVTLLRELSVRTGTFTLASGKTSDFYVDARQTTLHSEGSWLVGRLVLARLHPDAVGVGGMTLGADPIAAAAATLSTTVGRPVHGFIIRKEPKGHGVGSYMVGDVNLPRCAWSKTPRRPAARWCRRSDARKTRGSRSCR